MKIIKYVMNSVMAIYGACLEYTGLDEVRSTYGMSEQEGRVWKYKHMECQNSSCKELHGDPLVWFGPLNSFNS